MADPVKKETCGGLEEFDLEIFFGKHEFSAKHVLSLPCTEP